ncbi:hypothetical protein WH221_19190 [Chryseobacterium culicis]|uniref:Uncharacterized protein n=1 Tax=Chryseobacterium culicis TaxID=680127 RepID=A0A2S9CMR4_CHRCI|nr:hypothetical protein [Chryseobacterium culicis]PRB81793.1 hypothetical protein CQ022_19160 [Chryseobacterium culicis]PRB88448.1 hypothetical protein CQ033_18065 [Chryseobacterium culicis]
MKKKILPLVMMFAFLKAYTQVGINTTGPAATLDINVKNATGTSTNVEGVLITRLDRQRAQSMTGVPISTLIYVNSIATGSQTGTAVNVDTIGYYYYNGAAWVKLHNPTNSISANIYNTDGALTGNRIVSQGSNSLAFTGTQANAFSVDGATFSVDAANDRIGVGTQTPNAKLEINSSSSGVSGLKFTNLTSSSPTGTGQAIGVDASGNVISVSTVAQVLTVENAVSNPPSSLNFTVNDLGYIIIPGTIQNITIPTDGKALFINFMLGIDYSLPPSGSGSGFYQAILFIDNTATNVYQTVQESGAGEQAQFNLSSVKFLTSGNHTLDIRMIRKYNNGTTSGANISCTPVSVSFNSSYIN